MENSAIETVQKDLSELESFIEQSKRSNILRILKEQKILLESTLRNEQKKVSDAEKEKETVPTQTSFKDDKIAYTTITKYAFENSDKFAKLYFTEFANIKNHPTDKIKAEFKASSFVVVINDWNGKNMRFSSNNLNKTIIPSESYFKAAGSGLIVYLKKEKAEHWDGLEKKKGLISDDGQDKPEGLNTKDPNDPSGGLMNMMKEMYQNGDEQTKRMIAESWMKAQDGKTGGDMGGLPGMGGMPGMNKPGKGMPGMEGMGDLENMMKQMGGMGGMPDFSKMDPNMFKK